MRISRDKQIVEFIPENESEKVAISVLWNTLIDCNKFSKKLVPIGSYNPAESEMARFMIEGEGKDSVEYVPVTVDRDVRVYCQECNKYFDVKAGQEIPLCCGRTMEVMD
jgi:hypothetical protein